MDKPFFIWDNDAGSLLESALEDDVPNYDYAEAVEALAEDLELEVDTLNSADVKRPLVAVGTIVRWDGPREGHLLLKSGKLGDALKETVRSFTGDGLISSEVSTDGRLIVRALGHDNPTNPSVVEIRELTVGDPEDAEFSNNAELVASSEPTGAKAMAAYGFDLAFNEEAQTEGDLEPDV